VWGRARSCPPTPSSLSFFLLPHTVDCSSPTDLLFCLSAGLSILPSWRRLHVLDKPHASYSNSRTPHDWTYRKQRRRSTRQSILLRLTFHRVSFGGKTFPLLTTGRCKASSFPPRVDVCIPQTGRRSMHRCTAHGSNMDHNGAKQQCSRNSPVPFFCFSWQIRVCGVI
jgi:hypothetical protein